MSMNPTLAQAPNGSRYTLEALTPDSPEATVAVARELLIEYGHFVAAQPTIATFCFGDLEQEATQLPQSYFDLGGGALIARVAGKPVGFVAWKPFTDPKLASAWEVKRLWVRPTGRGLGIGLGLIQHLEQCARDAGKAHLLLDTAPHSMPAAYRLYQEMGFSDCPSYNGTTPPGIIFMRKEL